MPGLPSGTVTFLFTDIEGSTRLLEEHGDAYAGLLEDHRRVLREAIARHEGVEVDTQGDAFFVAFSSATDAVAAAADAQKELSVPVRMGVHTGEPVLAGEGYVGMDVHLGARICSAAHGGQLVLSEATRVLVDGTGLRSLGEHRLKDFDEAIALYQLGESEFPPLRTISNTNLPRPASSFLGRAREIEHVSALFAGTRLVTLTGPGGSGKTRLAIEVASGLLTEFPAGVFWVGLASLRDPALVLDSVAQVVGARGDLVSHIGDRELLLLLDNLEQVVEAAPELSTLLSACSNLRLLVTSRELLRIQGEVEYAVPPLSDREAVELFCERSRLGPSEEITELCRRLDDLPLAVELAAARTSVLSPAQILARLSQRLDLLKGGRDVETRQRTLRATIEWSYDLLSPEEQRLLAQLGVFTGGWSLEAAEAVCGADLDTLQSLVDKSLIRHTGERFWMLETIREYSVDRLEESGEAGKSRAAHAQYYLDVVEDLEPRLRGGGAAQEAAFQRLEEELDNLRAVLQFGLDCHADLLVRLVAGFGFFLLVRGHEDEARRWSALASRTRAGTPTARARVLRFAGRSALNVRDLVEARAFFGEALEVSRQAGDNQSQGESLRGLGDVATIEGDAEGARPFFEQARVVSEAAGNDWSVGAILSSLANLAMTQSRWEEAYTLSTEAAERLRASGDWAGATSLLADVGLSALRLGRRSEARTALAAVVVSDVADPEAVAFAFDSLAWLLAEGGHCAVSAEVLGAAAELFKDVGTTRGAPEQALRDDALLRLRGLMSPGELEEAIRRGSRLSQEDAAQLALAALD